MKHRFLELTLKRHIIFFLASLMLSSSAFSQTLPNEIITYKVIGDSHLKLHVFNPPNHKSKDSKPAIVFFFGGGWIGGTPKQFYEQSRYLASRGMVAISAEYRVRKVHKTSPKEALKDSKSAMRWVREHAKKLGINPKKIAAGGGSAGGHLAIATAVVEGFNDINDNLAVSALPNALILFNPVFDNSVNGYGYKRVKDYWEAFSPLHNLDEDVPPTIVLQGTNDKHIPIETVKIFKSKMLSKGRRCELVLYPSQPHGFFNKNKKNHKYKETLFEVDKFLTSLEYLEGRASLYL